MQLARIFRKKVFRIYFYSFLHAEDNDYMFHKVYSQKTKHYMTHFIQIALS